MSTVTKISTVSALIVGALTLTACSSNSPSTDDAGHSLVQAGTLTICTNAPFEPFEYTDEDGNLTGIDIDLTKLAAEELGLEYEAIQYDFDAMASGAAFASNNCDVLATGLTITAARQAKFDFSTPYFDANQGVLVSNGTALTSLADLAGKKVGAQIDSTGKTVGQDAGLEITEFPEVGSLIQAVSTGQIDAAIADIGVLQSYVNDDLTIAFTEQTDEQYGFGVKKGNTKLLEALNTTITNAKESGKYDEIITTHVGAAGN
ncbi:transporter substrate-binding domain-containing protein [Timonella sp. A28]|uniref:transporter substrate-binding domain-containing protein n=1 Tax=Timonella sp. A28 TaxID=3442640 RepID=UPI003EC00A3C